MPTTRETLRQLCDRLGWTQTDLERETGISRSTLHNVHTGRVAARRATILALAYVLQVDAEMVQAAVQESYRQASGRGA